MPDRSTRSQVLRFLALGMGNTVATYLLLLVLALFVDARLAYTVAFATGIAINTFLTGPVVFTNRPSPRRLWGYAAWLLVVYAAGLAAVWVALTAELSSRALVAAIPLLVTAPLSFLGGRVLLRRPVASKERERTSS